MSPPTVDTVPFVGGHPALDLLNTVERQQTDAPIELLADGRALARWARRAGLGGGRPGDDEAARVRALREALRSALRDGSNLEMLRAEWLDALAAARLAAESGSGMGLDMTWPDGPAAIRHRLAGAAFALLADPALRARIGTCHGDGCGGAFLDTSRNGSRRFCSSEGCGNRERVRRHRARRG